MNLLPLDDPRWAIYRGGYNRTLYNVVPLIRGLLRDGASEKFWGTVWEELHHQGDVGEASYALVPYLVHYQTTRHELDEQLFHFCVVVDLAQPENDNPPIPKELEFSYAAALRELPVAGVQRLRRGCAEHLIMGVTAATALTAGHRVLARAYLDFARSAALAYLHELNGFKPRPHDDV
jgi:hypothetical protein